MLKDVREHLEVARASGIENGEHDASEGSLEFWFAEDIGEFLGDQVGRVWERPQPKAPSITVVFPCSCAAVSTDRIVLLVF